MRNDLVGNVADYFKYGLLRALTSASNDSEALRLGVVWFLDNSGARQSNSTGWDYLSDETGVFERCDAALFHKMQAFANRERRDIENIASWEILPDRTLFFAKPLPEPQDAEAMSNGLKQARALWLRAALDRIEKADIVFLDPNKGLEVGGASQTGKASKDYCFYSDLAAFWQKSKSLILFQSRERTPAQVQVGHRIDELKAYLDGAQFIEPVYFQHVHGSLFFVAAQPTHADLLRRRLDSARGKWQPHMRRIS